jgi:GGDEF domain-containing protein
VIARIGGDEFAVLLRETSEAEGDAVAASLVAAIKGKPDPGVGVSIDAIVSIAPASHVLDLLAHFGRCSRSG